MSDFDKEAEREKLRKKFADDEKKRAGTRRMSELLLKGATMTNKHCNQCSDPLFRYNGQTFCPSCQTDEAAQADTTATTESAPGTNADSTATEAAQTDTSDGAPDRSAVDHSTQPQVDQSVETAQSTRQSEPVSSVTGRTEKTQSSVDASDRTPTSTGDLTEARQSLTRTVTRFARDAERTDDPRRARELLSAAREAAATLAELD